MKLKSLIIVLTISFFSCKNDTKFSYVDQGSKVLDSIYSESLPQIKGLFNKINALNLDQLLSPKFQIIDSTNIEELLVKKNEILKTKPFVKVNLNLTYKNTIVINNSSNWLSLIGINDDLIKQYNTDYILTNFSDGKYENSPLHRSDLAPDFFHYYYNPNFFDRYKDSIRSLKKNRLKLDRQSRLNKMKQIEYGLIINDIYAKPPSLIGRDRFLAGMMMSTAHLIDLKTQEILGYTTITVKSSQEVRHQAIADIRNIRGTILNRRLKEDLLKQRNKRFVDHFNIR